MNNQFFLWSFISSVSQRVDAGHGASRGEELASGVIGVGGDAVSAGVEDAGDFSLQVGQAKC